MIENFWNTCDIGFLRFLMLKSVPKNEMHIIYHCYC